MKHILVVLPVLCLPLFAADEPKRPAAWRALRVLEQSQRLEKDNPKLAAEKPAAAIELCPKIEAAKALYDEGMALVKASHIDAAKKKLLEADALAPGIAGQITDAELQRTAQALQQDRDAARINDNKNRPRRSRTGE